VVLKDSPFLDNRRWVHTQAALRELFYLWQDLKSNTTTVNPLLAHGSPFPWRLEKEISVLGRNTGSPRPRDSLSLLKGDRQRWVRRGNKERGRADQGKAGRRT